MIEKIDIHNFKSIVDLTFPLGRFNVLIGENGCGKSNILEAIAFASAASVDQLDVHDLEKRGMRVPAAQFMYSAFEKESDKDIRVDFTLESGTTEKFIMSFNNDLDAGRWIERRRSMASEAIRIFKSNKLDDAIGRLADMGFHKEDADLNIDLIDDEFRISLNRHSPEISGFRIYAPNEQALRGFDNPDNTTIAVDGKGLFSYLKKFSKMRKGEDMIRELCECMGILDWFDDMKFNPDSLSADNMVMLHDQYIDEAIRYFDQRSVNEAFLYLLFFYTLFISENSPRFFAVDNIESALNPKLCIRFTRSLIDLAEKYDKQVIVTTHNPFVLDALDLNVEDQRLFVVRRDVDGHTMMNRIQSGDKLTIPLSEAWMKGYIGGLPNNF